MKLVSLSTSQSTGLLQTAIDDLQVYISDKLQEHLNTGKKIKNSHLNDSGFDSFEKLFVSWHLPAELSFDEQLVLLISLVPHLQPNFFEQIILQALPNGGDFPEFGGVKGNNHRGVMPTGETIQFILAGNDIDNRLKVQHYFREAHYYRNI